MIFGTVALAGSNSTTGTFNGYTHTLSCTSNRPEASAQFFYGGSGTREVYGTVNYVKMTNAVVQYDLHGTSSSGTASDTFTRANIYEYITSVTNVYGKIGSHQFGNIAAYSGLSK